MDSSCDREFRCRITGSGKNWAVACALAASTIAIGLSLAGCKRLLAPQPPFIGLPESVKDLASIRAGNQIWLGWTMPTKATRKFAVNGRVQVRVCRREEMVGACTDAGEPLLLAPGATGSFSEVLPAALASGTPRALDYSVELIDSRGHLAGASNRVVTLAGAAPPAVRGLTAEMYKGDVLLSWIPSTSAMEPTGTIIRFYRERLTSDSEDPRQRSTLESPELAQPKLMAGADSTPGRTLDTDIRVGNTYEYRAQRVVRVPANGKTLELVGELSQAVRIEVPAASN